MKPKVDHGATRQKYMEFRLQNIAAHCGVSPAIVTAVMDGYYKQMESESALKVLQRFRELGFLVELPELDTVDESGWGQERLAA